MKSAIILAALASLSAHAAQADEEWSRSNEAGNFVYADDIDEIAVISYPVGDTGIEGTLFVDGLAGQDTERKHFLGYWTEPPREGTPSCSARIIDANGLETDYWGRIEVFFSEPEAPSDFVLLYGMCFEEPDTSVVATAVAHD